MDPSAIRQDNGGRPIRAPHHMSGGEHISVFADDHTATVRRPDDDPHRAREHLLGDPLLVPLHGLQLGQRLGLAPIEDLRQIDRTADRRFRRQTPLGTRNGQSRQEADHHPPVASCRWNPP